MADYTTNCVKPLSLVFAALVPPLKDHVADGDDKEDKDQNDQYFNGSGQECDERNYRL